MDENGKCEKGSFDRSGIPKSANEFHPSNCLHNKLLAEEFLVKKKYCMYIVFLPSRSNMSMNAFRV